MLYMDKIISSKDNKIYKELVKLNQKKYRDEMGKYLVEGENLLFEAIRYGHLIDKVILREDAAFTYGMKTATYKLSHNLFSQVAGTQTSQGVMAVIKKKVTGISDFGRLCDAKDNLVVLDRLQDPGNIGTVIRTAEGAGYRGVICIRGTADVYSPKVVRAAAGALFRVPILYISSTDELFELVKKLNKKLTVSILEGDYKYYNVNLKEGVVLVIGNEGNGCSAEIVEAADCRVTIPMAGELESLNAAVAAGILMYEAVRQ